MSVPLDLNLLPLLRESGQERSEMPGLYAVTPPHRAVHSRNSDYLILYLTITGTAPLIPEQYNQLLARLAQTYYKTNGSVTAAMRVLAESLNKYLRERNLNSSNTGRQAIGTLTQVVMRRETLYLAHSGLAHTFILGAQASQHMFDPQGSGRGLGVSQMTGLRYFQVALQPNEYMLLSHQPADGWDEASLRPPYQGMENLRRRLLGTPAADLSAVLVQTQAGTGKLRLLRLKAAFRDMARPSALQDQPSIVMQEETPAPAQEVLLPQTSAEPEVPVLAPLEMPPGVATDVLLADALRQVEPQPVEQVLEAPDARQIPAAPEVPPPAVSPRAGAPQQSKPAPASPKQTNPKIQKISPPKTFSGGAGIKRVIGGLAAALGTIGRAFKTALQQLVAAVASVLRRILPDENVLHIPPAMWVFIALTVPLVISIIGGIVYVERGQATRHNDLYQQAYNAALQAVSENDAGKMRTAWSQVLQYLDQAEAYRVTPESQALRIQAVQVLDRLDSVERVNFTSAIIGGLDEDINVIRMAISGGDLYLLDGVRGEVTRAILTGRGYEVDTQFTCGPLRGPNIVGPLIDIVALPSGNSQGATLLGMDANGMLIYCIPGDKPLSVPPAPPLINFGTPKALDVNEGDLYILDTLAKAVWIYRNMNTSQPPNMFFDEDIPFMQDVIDLTLNNNDLYLLHSDGRQSVCVFSGMEDGITRCDDPSSYTDTRPGRTSGSVITESVFNQVVYLPPPDPSLYLLDPKNQAIFHFSLRLTLQGQYRPLQTLSTGAATAFALAPNRTVFLAFGNEVYFAMLP